MVCKLSLTTYRVAFIIYLRHALKPLHSGGVAVGASANLGIGPGFALLVSSLWQIDSLAHFSYADWRCCWFCQRVRIHDVDTSLSEVQVAS